MRPERITSRRNRLFASGRFVGFSPPAGPGRRPLCEETEPNCWRAARWYGHGLETVILTDTLPTPEGAAARRYGGDVMESLSP
ncbi:MAG: hypothetical protein ACLU9S_05920 [Oscillospiraceae bacterium]